MSANGYDQDGCHQHDPHELGDHHGHRDADSDWVAMADLLEVQGETNSSYVRQALAELDYRSPRRILDIGSGPGVAACQLASTFPGAEVIAVDNAPELLIRAEERAKRLGVRLGTRTAEFPDGVADVGSADVVWSAQVVHHVGDQQAALHQLAGLLTPGGVLAIAEGGLPSRYLPRDLGFGRPGLQERLDAAMADRFSQMRDELPGSVAVAEDWPGMLRAAGLTEVRSRTFLVDHPAPLDDGPRRLVRLVLERYRQAVGELLDAEDLTTLDRLLDPLDAAAVDRRQDVFLLAATTVHYGRRAGR
ncbi:class I SAM-dependent methyltransferase [Nocardiopsis rhodophaea]|uniref:Class I SAM-dependent methyltransferase n=1 Tax=Nocardiopsis rhodophaea TaxID=280238 RepID=A0ABP5EW28_9ACTN